MKQLNKLATILIPLDALVSMVNNDGAFEPTEHDDRLPEDAVAVGVEADGDSMAVRLVVASESFKNHRQGAPLFCFTSLIFRKKCLSERLEATAAKIKTEIEEADSEAEKRHLSRTADYVKLAYEAAMDAQTAAWAAAETVRNKKREA